MFAGRKSGSYRSTRSVHNVKGIAHRTLVQVGELGTPWKPYISECSASTSFPLFRCSPERTDLLQPSRIGKGHQLTPTAGAVGGRTG